MGSNQSTRATHFQRPPNPQPAPVHEEEVDDNRISISNKMVERLVEDATLNGPAHPTSPNSTFGDFKEKIYIEKLKCLDDTHSERLGLTVDEVKAMTNRIEMRTSNMVSVEPVCADYKQIVIDCYNSTRTPSEAVECWDAVGAFSQCVQEAGAERLRARTERDARDQERRSRHVAHARVHALKELSGAHGDSPTYER
ncbi:uncharacterized protein LOC110991748 [Pieris rapae]|uniref:uncharacterized protein LOC110991748 n=1 Tax=Pieris rapae TaxID=64459 RepID=UPI000B92B43A|nr:uncharacterized protein LOC110991748 [Pieris rapae]